MINYARVQRIIDLALVIVPPGDRPAPASRAGRNIRILAAFGLLEAEFEENSSIPNPPSPPANPTTRQIETAFRALKRLRASGRSRDSELAAAEHYMFMRFLARVSGDPITVIMPAGYDVRKRIAFWRGNEEQMQVDEDSPPHPPNVHILQWGTRGAAQGLREFRQIRPNDGFQPGRALLSNETTILRGLSPWQQDIVQAVLRRIRTARGEGAT